MTEDERPVELTDDDRTEDQSRPSGEIGTGMPVGPAGDPERYRREREAAGGEPWTPMRQEQTAPPGADGEPLTSVGWSRAEAYLLVGATILLQIGVGVLLAQFGIDELSGGGQALVRGSAVLITYVLVLVTAWWVSRRHGSSLSAATGLRPYPWLKALGLGALFAFLARGAIIVWVALLRLFDVTLPGQDQIDVTRLLPLTPLGVALTVLIAVVAAPFVEEMVFRGVLLSALLQVRSRWAAFAVSAALFAILHFNTFTLVPIFILGLALAWLFWKTGSLWASIAGHAVFNAIAVVAAYAVRLA